jgi:tetratricopeptide (TPR) repeat protein
MRINSLLIAVLGVAAFSGCGSMSGRGSHGGEANKVAKEQWAHARANVLGSLAKEQYENGNFEKCRQTLTDAIKMDPDNAPIRLLSAKLAIEQGNLEFADKELVLARRLDPKSAEADYLEGVVCQRWQRSQDALDYYRSASEKQTNELAYLMAYAETLVSMGRSDEALTLLQGKVVFFEYSATIRDAVGELLMQKDKYHQAVEVLRQASILAAEDNGIREHLALACFYDKQYGDAADLFGRIVHDDKYAKRVDLFLFLGECQLKIDKPRDARDSFEAASQIAPNQAGVWTGLGKAALQINDLRRADISIRRSLSIEPGNGETNLLMGYVRLREGKLNEALAAFKKANSIDAADTVSLCMVGYVLEKMGKSDDALKCYTRALKMSPGDEMATRLLSQVQTDQ